MAGYEQKEIIKDLSDAVSNYDFDEAIALLDKHKIL
jgi:hypothetical protein